MKTIKLSSVHYEMAREKMEKRKIRTIEDYMEILIQDDYGKKMVDRESITQENC